MENTEATKGSNMRAFGALEIFPGKPAIFEKGELIGVYPKVYHCHIPPRPP